MYVNVRSKSYSHWLCIDKILALVWLNCIYVSSVLTLVYSVTDYVADNLYVIF